MIDYATARHQDEPISTAVTESTVPWLLHRRMNAQQHMRWSPLGARLMLKVRTATANGTLERGGHAVAERWARRPLRRAARGPPRFWTVSCYKKAPVAREGPRSWRRVSKLDA